MEPGFYAIDAISGAVGEGVTGSRYCTLGGIIKVDSPDAAYTVANEYVASRLAQLLGLPTPPGTVVKLADGSMGYAMMKFGLDGDSPPPTDPDDFVTDRAELAAGIVIFDAWILNGDRHPGNLAWIPSPRNLASVFDHGHALFGTAAGGAIAHLESNESDPAFGYGCLASRLRESRDLESWVQQVQAVRDRTIKEICRPIQGLGLCTKEERVKLEQVLMLRRDAMRSSLVASRDKFPGIEDDDWGLT